MKIKPKSSLTNPKAGRPVSFTFNFPDGFILIRDTREDQDDPLFLHLPKGLTLVRDYLPTGDYSIQGFESQISIERKKLYDLLNCLGKDRERFKKELTRLYVMEWRAIVVECSEEELLYNHHEFSQMEPEAVRQSITSIEIRLRIPFYFQPSRERLERWILDRLIKFFLVKRLG